MSVQRNASPSTIEQSNIRHLVWDIAWFGIALAGTSRFLSVFAIRLGATATDISWLSSLPALLLLISASLAGWWLRHFKSARRAMIFPTLIGRLVFLLPAFAPLVPQRWQALYLVLSASLPSVMQGFASTAFVVLMRSSVTDAVMPRLLSRRSLAMNITVALTAMAFGLWLDHTAFPQNYQLVFILSFIAALMSLRQVMYVDPSPNPCPLNPPVQITPANREAGKPWKSPQFRDVAVIVMIAYVAFCAVNSLVTLHLVNDLGASEGFIALYGIVELAAAAGVSVFSAQIARSIGNRAMIAISMIFTGIAVLIVALSPSLALTLIAAAIGGASWTMVAMIGLFSYFTENTPTEHYAAYSAAYHQVIGLATFVGPLIGSLLARGNADLATVLVIGGMIRIASAPLIDRRLLDPIKLAGTAMLRLREAD